MAVGPDPIEAAFERVTLLQRIVAAERTRAEREPNGPRNIEQGIVGPQLPRDRIPGEIARRFDDLDLFLDHLLVFAMAAAFEHAAKARIGNAVGAARSAIEKGKKFADRWPTKLVRDAASIESLRDIGDLLGLDVDALQYFVQIRSVRNDLSHGMPIRGVPVITSEATRDTLASALERLKGR